MTELVKYDAMCHAIAEAHRIDEVKDIRDKLVAMESYARQAKNTEAETQVREIRLRAEKQCGALLKVMPKAPGHRFAGPSEKVGPVTETTLADLGITYKQSSSWQQLDDVPYEVFENGVKQPKASAEKIVNLAKKRKEKQKPPPKEELSRNEKLQKMNKHLDDILRGLEKVFASHNRLESLVETIDDLRFVEYTLQSCNTLDQIARLFRTMEKIFATKNTLEIPLLKLK